MSAYIVDLDTIAYLTEAARRWRVHVYAPLPTSGPYADPVRLAAARTKRGALHYDLHAVTDYHLYGAVLYAANVASVNYRYHKRTKKTLPEGWLARAIPGDIDPVVVLKSVACLRYQSCERPGYYQTFGYALLADLEQEAIRHLRGFEDAPWGWTRDSGASTPLEVGVRWIGGGQ